MAVVLGTSAGFVTARPTGTPDTNGSTLDTNAVAFRDTAPAGATAITEIGWFCPAATEAANFQVGLYSDDAVNDEPEDRLAVSGDTAKGTDAGWKYAAVSYAVSAGTKYWIAVQLDDTTTGTNYIYTVDGGGTSYRAYKSSQTELPAAWGTSSGKGADRVISFYVVYTTVSGGVVAKVMAARRRRA